MDECEHNMSGKGSEFFREKEFFRLFVDNQNKIYSYILALMPNRTDADDIFQETAAIMWRKFESFKLGTDFTAWGVKVAYFQIQDYRRQRSKSRVRYSSRTLEVISDHLQAQRQERDVRIGYLGDCLTRLSEKDQKLIQLKYSQKITTRKLATMVGRSVDGLYKSIARIHGLLLECIQRMVSVDRIL